MVFQDKSSLKAAVSIDRVHCISMIRAACQVHVTCVPLPIVPQPGQEGDQGQPLSQEDILRLQQMGQGPGGEGGWTTSSVTKTSKKTITGPDGTTTVEVRI